VKGRLAGLALGVLTAIGGFLDIGDIVTNGVVGARFGLSLAWVTPLGVAGIMLFAEMSGRVAACSGRATFEIIRERLGPRVGGANLIGSVLTTVLTLTAEIGGIAAVLHIASDIRPMLWVPVAAFGVWVILWRVRFSVMQNVTGLLGLLLMIFAVTFFLLSPSPSEIAADLVPRLPTDEADPVYWYYAVALFGAAMTPYEVFFFSSGGVEERWTTDDIRRMRINVLIGFPIGGIGSLAIMGTSSFAFGQAGIDVDSLSTLMLPVAEVGGQLAVALALIGVLAATVGASLETALSTGYAVAQYSGWTWGATRRPRDAARFHVVMLAAIVAGSLILLTGVDPVAVTEYSVVFSAIALPLTYLPILVVAGDREYMGEHANGRLSNALGTVFLGLVLVVSVAAIPLMIVTGAGR
jgi:Mn2+/Fe2+ NRAMP family transporter